LIYLQRHGQRDGSWENSQRPMGRRRAGPSTICWDAGFCASAG